MNIIFDMAFGSLIYYTITSFIIFTLLIFLFIKIFKSSFRDQFLRKRDYFYFFLIILMLFAGIRNSFERKSFGIVDAYAVSKTSSGVLAINGFYSFYRTLGVYKGTERKSLMPYDKAKEIAKDFFSELEIDYGNPEDIVFTGSLANYNYTKYSDIDLHIILDFNKIRKDCNIVSLYLDDERILYNNTHSITLKGYPVEVYIEDISTPAKSGAIYSIVKDDWIIRPSKTKPNLDDKSIIAKVNKYRAMIKKTIDEENILNLIKLKNRVKLMRKSGLEKNGEFSTENLTYKIEGVDDILRLNMNSFMYKMDNPEISLFYIDKNDEVDKLMANKVYYVNFIVRLRHEDEEYFKRYRVILTRSGILEIEDLY